AGRGGSPRPRGRGPRVTTFLAVLGSVTPPGRLNAAIATAVAVAGARHAAPARLWPARDAVPRRRRQRHAARPPERRDRYRGGHGGGATRRVGVAPEPGRLPRL